VVSGRESPFGMECGEKKIDREEGKRKKKGRETGHTESCQLVAKEGKEDLSAGSIKKKERYPRKEKGEREK